MIVMTSSRICFIFSFFACSAASACDNKLDHATIHLSKENRQATGKKNYFKNTKTPLDSNITPEIYLFVLAQNAGHLFHFWLQVCGLFPLTFLLLPLTFLLFLLPASSCAVMPPKRGWVRDERNIFWDPGGFLDRFTGYNMRRQLMNFHSKV